LTPMSSLSPCCSSSCECLVCPSILTSVYVVFSVIVVVVSRATLSISFPLVVVYFTFSIRIVCIHFYRLYHVCRYPSLPSHGHRSFQSPWAVLGQCRTTTTTRCIGQCLFHSSASLCPLPDTKAICDPLPVKIHSPFQQTSSEVSLKTWWVSGLIFSSLGLVWESPKDSIHFLDIFWALGTISIFWNTRRTPRNKKISYIPW
jgi:hypothetical protein